MGSYAVYRKQYHEKGVKPADEMAQGMRDNLKPNHPADDVIWWQIDDNHHQSVIIYSSEEAAKSIVQRQKHIVQRVQMNIQFVQLKNTSDQCWHRCLNYENGLRLAHFLAATQEKPNLAPTSADSDQMLSAPCSLILSVSIHVLACVYTVRTTRKIEAYSRDQTY